MSDNKTRILKEFEDLKGQFVIRDFERVSRLVSVGEDDMDYYWILYDGRKLTWQTCVGRIIPLKGRIAEADYASLVRIARLNHYDQSTYWGSENNPEILKFNAEHKQELEQAPEGHKFLVEFCWDL